MIDLYTFYQQNFQKFHPRPYGDLVEMTEDKQELYNICTLTSPEFKHLINCCKMIEEGVFSRTEISYPFWEYWFDQKRYVPRFGKLLKSFVFFRTLCLRK